MPRVRAFEEDEIRKFTKDILGNKIEVGDYVVMLDRFTETGYPKLNIAFVQDITDGGKLRIKNLVFKGQFLKYNRQWISKKMKFVVSDELDCMRFQLFTEK